MRKLYFLVTTLLMVTLTSLGQTYHKLSVGPLTENWTNTGLIVTNDDWSGVPSIRGFLGQDLTAATGTDPQTILTGASPLANDLDVIANQTNTNITNGGVAEFHIANPTIALQGSGTADAPYLVLYLNTQGVNNINIQYRLRDVDGTADNAIQPVALQYRIGKSGNFTNIPAAFVADATSGPSLATQETVVSVLLPAACENQQEVELRIITTNAASNDEWVGIDDISVSASATPTPTMSVAAGVNAAEPSTDGTFTVSLSAPAPANGVTVEYTLTGSATSGTDYNDALKGSLTISQGSSTATLTLTPKDDADYEGTETITITLTGATGGYLLAGSTASIDLLDNDTAPAPTVVINQVYGGGGNSNTLYKNDFIELYNFGNTPVSLNGWSVQYASASGSSWQVTPLTGSIPARGYYLIQQAAEGGGTKPLPTADAFGGIAMAASSGKVILSNSTTALTGPNPVSVSVIDKVGYGSATGFETAATPALSSTTAARRATDGVDTDNNAADFIVSAPLPRNTTYTTTPPVVTSLTPSTNYTGVSPTATPLIGFDKPVQKGSGTITVLENGMAVAALDVTSGSVVLTDAFTAAINIPLAPGKTYSIQVAPGTFKDLYGNAFAGLSTGWTFTTYNTDIAEPLPLTFNFNSCTGSGLLPQGFTRYSASGVHQWDCSTFGRDPSDASKSLASGVQINGYDGTNNIPNVDWLISPKIDLSNTAFPLLSFWSRRAFAGQSLQLKISTDYTGGNPALATWTDLNGKFPEEAVTVWTESKDINLARFKGGHVHIAFVYTSTDEDGARWTLDDIAVTNSLTQPPPSLTVEATDLQLGYAARGSSSEKKFTFTGNDLTGDVTLTATAPFLLSKDGSTYSSSIVYSQSEANDLEQSAWVRFAPSEKNQDFTGTLTISTPGQSQTVALKGTSINPDATLEVVNWNIEWFGSPQYGPGNDDLQETNVRKVFQSLNADIYALGEIVSEERLARVVSNMPGYAYVIGNFGSHTNPYASSPSPLTEAQKLAFVYKTSVVKNLGTRAMLSKGINTREDLSSPYYSDWSSGRFPLLLQADVTLNCVTRQVNFVMVHAKANTNPVDKSYDRRKAGAQALHDSLNLLFPEGNVVILGDFNDDLDVSIMDNKSVTSWNAFTNDAVNYTALTLPLSLTGKKSTVGHNDVIDHVVVSNEMEAYYMAGSANIVTDVTGVVSSYGTTTSDHYPVFTRYRFEEPAAPVVTVCPEAAAFCVSSTGRYTMGEFAAEAKCGAVSYSFEITGATTRNGMGNNASGAFNVGVSTITWTATDILGNSSTCQTTVTVNANPSVTIADAYALPAGTKVNTVYIGYSPASSLTLSATASGGTADYTYAWEGGTSGSSLTVSPTTSTEYTVTATDANGCTAMASKEVAVMDVRAGKNGDKVLVCHKYPRKNATLEIGPEGVADHLAHGDQLGGCGMDASVTQKAESAEPGLQLVLEALPNPSAGVFTVSFRGGHQAAKAQLFVTDMLGRVVETRSNLQTNATYTLGSGYRSGVYLVSVLHNGERYTLKLVKR